MVMITDPVGDMLTRIRNGALAGKKRVKLPASKLKEGVARVLVEEGFLSEWQIEEEEGKKRLAVTLVYAGGQPVLSGLARVSRPGRRVYKAAKERRRGQGGGMMIVSTPRGVMSDKKARKANLGGEILAEVW